MADKWSEFYLAHKYPYEHIIWIITTMMHNYIGHKPYPKAITEFQVAILKSKMIDMSLKLLFTSSTSLCTSINGVESKFRLLHAPKPSIVAITCILGSHFENHCLGDYSCVSELASRRNLR